MQAAVFVGGQSYLKVGNRFGSLSSGQVCASKGLMRGQQFRVAVHGALEQGDCLFRPLEVEQCVAYQITQLRRPRPPPKEILEQGQSPAIVLAEFKTNGKLFLNLWIAGRKLPGCSPFVRGFGVSFLSAVNMGFQLVLFPGRRQPAKASEGLESQLVVGSRAPIVRLRSIRTLRGDDKPTVLSRLELALECLSTTIRLGKLALLLFFDIRPVRMSGLAIDLRYCRVQTPHRWHLLYRVTVQIKTA